MKPIYILAIGSFVLISCNKNSKTTETKTQITTEKTQNSLEKSPSLQLNRKEKWDVNSEMKPFVFQGEKLVTTYMDRNKTDYKVLAQQLAFQNNQLIKSCTMKGASHDELHKWLHPHLELVGKLARTNDDENAQIIVKQLVLSYETYNQYFN